MASIGADGHASREHQVVARQWQAERLPTVRVHDMDRIVLSDHRQIPPIRADAFDDVVGVCERRADGFTRLGVQNLKASLVRVMTCSPSAVS